MAATEHLKEYRVVRNHEEQYSIWPAGDELPAGWRDAGFRGTREECLAHIDEVWTDMRPLSLRLAMDGGPQGGGPQGGGPQGGGA